MKKIKKLLIINVALVLSFVALLGLIHVPKVDATAPYTCTWTGGGGNTNFSTAGNWSNCNAAAPGTGDNLIFDNTNLTANQTLNDDISGLAVGNITFQGSSLNYQYTITGDAISLSGGIAQTSYSEPVIDNSLTLTANQSFTGNGLTFGDNSHSPTLNVGSYTLTIGSSSSSGYLSLDGGSIAGNGAIVVVAGSGNFAALYSVLGGSSSGWTGTLTAEGSAAINIGSGVLQNTSNISISGGASLCLANFNGNNFAPNLVVGGTDAIEASTCSGGGGGGVASYSATNSVNLTGSLTLTANTTVNTSGTVTISGPLTGNYSIGLDSGLVGKLVINSSHNTSNTPNGNLSSPLQIITVVAGDNQPSAQILIGSNQEYIIDGIRGSTEVGSGGILKGTGTVGGLNVDQGGVVSPGDAPGCITVNGNLQISGTYQAEIGGTTPCTGYDQLDVTGTVTLNEGSGTPAGTLQLSIINGFKPQVGQTFEIINNEGSSPVSGTFANLPEGSTINVGGNVFRISYKGGKGNAVVLTVITAATPDTGFGLSSFNVLAPLLGIAFVIVGVYIIATRLVKITIHKH